MWNHPYRNRKKLERNLYNRHYDIDMGLKKHQRQKWDHHKPHLVIDRGLSEIMELALGKQKQLWADYGSSPLLTEND